MWNEVKHLVVYLLIWWQRAWHRTCGLLTAHWTSLHRTWFTPCAPLTAAAFYDARL